MSRSRAIGNGGQELYKTQSKRRLLDPQISCATEHTVSIVEVRELSSFLTEDIGVERSANPGHSVDFGRKPKLTFFEKTAPVVRCNGILGRGGGRLTNPEGFRGPT